MVDDKYIQEAYAYLSQHPEESALPPDYVVRLMMLDAAKNGTWASEEVKQKVIDSIIDFGNEMGDVHV